MELKQFFCTLYNVRGEKKTCIDRGTPYFSHVNKIQSAESFDDAASSLSDLIKSRFRYCRRHQHYRQGQFVGFTSFLYLFFQSESSMTWLKAEDFNDLRKVTVKINCEVDRRCECIYLSIKSMFDVLKLYKIKLNKVSRLSFVFKFCLSSFLKFAKSTLFESFHG